MQSDKKVWDWRSYIINYAPENSTYRHLLLTLSCFMDSSGGSCFPSVKKLVECSSLTKPTVLKYLKKAYKDGWIEVEKVGLKGQKWRRQQYTASIPEKVVKEINHVDEGGKTDKKGGKRALSKVVKQVDQYNNSPSTSTNNSPDISPLIKNYSHLQEMEEPLTVEEGERLIQEYGRDTVKDVLQRMENWKGIENNNVSTNLTARNWIRKDLDHNGTQKVIDGGLWNE